MLVFTSFPNIIGIRLQLRMWKWISLLGFRNLSTAKIRGRITRIKKKQQQQPVHQRQFLYGWCDHTQEVRRNAKWLKSSMCSLKCKMCCARSLNWGNRINNWPLKWQNDTALTFCISNFTKEKQIYVCISARVNAEHSARVERRQKSAVRQLYFKNDRTHVPHNTVRYVCGFSTYDCMICDTRKKKQLFSSLLFFFLFSLFFRFSTWHSVLNITLFIFQLGDTASEYRIYF